MKKVLKEFQFVLSDPIKFAHEGASETGFNITLKAPGNIHARFCNKLSKAFLSASRKLAEVEEAKATSKGKQAKTPSSNEDAGKIDGQMIVTVMSLTEDMDSIHESFREFMCYVNDYKMGSVCLIEGKCIMTQAIYDQMLLSDTNRLLGEYIQNFLIPS